MKRLLLSVLIAGLYISSAHGCPITFVNDTQYRVFAFDMGYNEGNIMEPGQQRVYGAETRHPDVTIYMQSVAGSDTFKRSFHIEQKQCALHDADKTIRLSSVIANDGTISTDIYAITNYTTGADILPCCAHHGSPMNHSQVMDEPVSAMDEE